MEVKVPCTYILKVKETGHFYVGSSNKIKTRTNVHLSQLKKGVHHNARLQKLFNEGNTVSLSRVYFFETIHQAQEMELSTISENKDNPLMLNIGLGVKGGDNLTRNDNREDIIKKITSSIRKRVSNYTEEDRKLLSLRASGPNNGMYGKTHTPEVRKRLSEINKGNRYNVGRKLSPEHCRKMSEYAKTRLGPKNSFYGRHHSEKTKRTLSLRMMGRKPQNTNKVSIDGVEYLSQADAAKALDVCVGTISFRLRSKNPRFKNYRVIKTDSI